MDKKSSIPGKIAAKQETIGEEKNPQKDYRSIDMTSGPIVGPLFKFILPIIFSSLFQQLYNTVDFLFVGNYMDKTAAAAVGASSTLISCIIGLFSGISVGTSVIAGRAIGARDYQKASKALHTSVTFGLVGGAALLILGIFFAPDILQLLRTPVEVMPQAVLYIRIYLISVPMMVFYNMVSGGMRSYGDSQTPFRILAICGFLNVLMDALFIVVIPLGVAGVAIATAITQSFSAILAAYFASRQNRMIRLEWKELGIDTKMLGEVLRIGLPTGIQTIIITFSNVMVQYYINAFGETAVAAFATYYKVENIIYLPIVGFGQAATTFSAQNAGAGNYRRLRRGTIITMGLGVAVTAVIAGLILCWPRTVFTWFMKDQDVVTNALRIAMISFPFYWIYPILEVNGGALRGMGKTLLSMITVVLNMCVLRVALLAIFSRLFHTIESLGACYPITWATAGISFLILFHILVRKKIEVQEPNRAKM